MDAEAPVRSTEGAQSIRRALAVLRIVAAGQELGVRLVDVERACGLNRPTAHRILRVLVEEGACEQDPTTRRYLIGGEVALLGLARRARFPLRGLAAPHLRALSESLGDTTFLTIRNGDDSVCVERCVGSYPVKVLSIEIGARRPLGVGVSGLVLLAALPDDEMRAVVRRNRQRLRAMQVDADELLRRAERVRRQDHAFASVGVVPGSRAVAVPVRDPQGGTIAGIAVATITARMPASRVPEVVQAMAVEASAITAALVGQATSRRRP